MTVVLAVGASRLAAHREMRATRKMDGVSRVDKDAEEEATVGQPLEARVTLRVVVGLPWEEVSRLDLVTEV